METSRMEMTDTAGRACRKDVGLETSIRKTTALKLDWAQGLGWQENMRQFAKEDKSNASQHGNEARTLGVPFRHTPVLEDCS